MHVVSRENAYEIAVVVNDKEVADTHRDEEAVSTSHRAIFIDDMRGANHDTLEIKRHFGAVVSVVLIVVGDSRRAGVKCIRGQARGKSRRQVSVRFEIVARTAESLDMFAKDESYKFWRAAAATFGFW